VIAATTTSNIAGGYIEPKKTMYDLPGQTLYRFIKAWRNARRGVYPDLHFGFKIYTDVLDDLKEVDDRSIGYALRNARNRYLPEDGDWLVWWSPPLFTTGDAQLDAELLGDMTSTARAQLDPRLDNKFQSFYEYVLYGDPAFVPYVPSKN